MKVIKRDLQNQILKALKTFPSVYINGPRQAGKTTLVKTLLADDFKAQFITFDDTLERAAAMRNPSGYISEAGTPLIIDEVQMAPEIFLPLKKLIDEKRQIALADGKTANGQYLLTGSANLLALPQLANAMVGRMATITLLPFSVSEVQDTRANFFSCCFTKKFPEIKVDNISIIEMMKKATFPELLNISSQEMIDTWFNNYIQKITSEDPRHIYNLDKAEYIPILLQALAARAGNLINDANIGREIGLNAVTTRTYRNLLRNTFITYNLTPWYRNITKRLVKSNKIYFYDTMLLCYLLGSTPENLKKNAPHHFGHILENFILTELIKMNHSTGNKIDISFYRTNDEHEIDFILEKDHKLVAIEVKNAENISTKDLASIKELKQAIGKDFYCGIILCNTRRVIPIEKDIYLLPFSALWQN